MIALRKQLTTEKQTLTELEQQARREPANTAKILAYKKQRDLVSTMEKEIASMRG